MKLYRRGLLSDAKAYLKRLPFLRPNRQRINAFPTNLGLSFKDQIFVRAQSWILIPEDQGSIMPKLRFTRVCEHLDSPYDTSPYSMIFQCKLEHFADKQDLTEICCILIRCRYCPTALLVEAKRLNKDSKGGLLTITKWQDLGCGLSPSEVRWKSDLEYPGTPWPYLPDDELGSIRASYEDQPGTRYKSLLKEAKAWKLLEKAREDFEAYNIYNKYDDLRRVLFGMDSVQE